jgi:hypothetical protein
VLLLPKLLLRLRRKQLLLRLHLLLQLLLLGCSCWSANSRSSCCSTLRFRCRRHSLVLHLLAIDCSRCVRDSHSSCCSTVSVPRSRHTLLLLLLHPASPLLPLQLQLCLLSLAHFCQLPFLLLLPCLCQLRGQCGAAQQLQQQPTQVAHTCMVQLAVHLLHAAFTDTDSKMQ